MKSEKGATPKSSYHHGNLREALIDAGLNRLEDGRRGEVSLRELARQVGVSVNAAYRHFANKEAVLSALATEGFLRFDQAQKNAVQSQTDPEQAFLELGRAYIRFARQNPALFRLMFGRFDEEPVDEALEQASRTAFQTLLDSVAATTQLTAEDPAVKILALRAWGQVHGLSHLLLDGQLDHLGDDPMILIDAALKGATQ